VFDINADGVANYGLFPDWIEDLRMIAGDAIVKDLSRSSEAYVEMWERTEGVPDSHCLPALASFTGAGLATARLNSTHEQLLRRAGQPAERSGRVWRYCAARQQGRVSTVLTPAGKVALVASTAPGHKARSIGPFDSSRKLGSSAAGLRSATIVRRAGPASSFVYGVRYGRVSYVALVTRSVSARSSTLRSYLRLAGLG
jgi:hypothetical protein